MTGNHPKISIIVPVLNEGTGISRFLGYLKRELTTDLNLEILIVDGGSVDDTVRKTIIHGVRVVHSSRGRALQMNMGARMASGSILYFLHADTFPPSGFARIIRMAVENGEEAGCFRMKFDSDSLFLQLFSWFSRFNYPFCRGGDQSLFITRSLFDLCGGFNEAYRIYEDNELTSRLYSMGYFKVLPEYVTTSARRYRQKNYISLQYHFGIMHLKNYLGAGPESLHRYYNRNIAL